MIAMALAEGSSDLATRVAEKVKAKFLEENSGHDWHHISRVRKLAWQIAGQEGANQEVAELAALVHAGTRRDRLRIIGTSRSSRRKGGRNQTRPLSNYLTVRSWNPIGQRNAKKRAGAPSTSRRLTKKEQNTIAVSDRAHRRHNSPVSGPGLANSIPADAITMRSLRQTQAHGPRGWRHYLHIVAICA